MSVAQVCRRSWKRISGSPPRTRCGLKERVTRLWRLMGVPTRVGNTKSQSRQFDKLLALFNLAFAVFLEGFHVLGGKLHGTTAFRRLQRVAMRMGCMASWSDE